MVMIGDLYYILAYRYERLWVFMSKCHTVIDNLKLSYQLAFTDCDFYMPQCSYRLIVWDCRNMRGMYHDEYEPRRWKKVWLTDGMHDYIHEIREIMGIYD
jgi:hypothetical protein